MNYKYISCLILISSILISGCVTLTYDTKVDRNGGIVEHTMVIETSSYVYALMNEETQIRDIVVSEGGEYSEVWDGDNVQMIISGLIPPNIYTETDGDHLIYRHTITDNFTTDYSEYGAAAIDVHYYLEMPGEIVESNANVVDGNKAEWHMVGSTQPEDIYARCELPSIPGFEILSSILAILAIAFFFRKG